MKAADAIRSQFGAGLRQAVGTGPEGRADRGVSQLGTDARSEGARKVSGAFAIDLDRLWPDPGQPRKEFDPDEIAVLAASLRDRGQLQPIRVRWDEPTARWTIVTGERRWRAARLAGLASVVCMEAKGQPTPDELLEDQLVENCVRSDLKPIEQARAFKSLMESRGLSYRGLAERLHVSKSAVERALALLELPADQQAEIDTGQVAASVGYQQVQATRARQADRPRPRARKTGGTRPRTFRMPHVRIRVEPSRKATRADVVAALRAVLSQLETELSQEGERAA